MTVTSSPTVRVRFAPSPTGYLHIGGLRTALYNWLFARKYGGTFILRVEDTDRTRLVEDAVMGLARSMQRLGVEADEGLLLVDGQLKDVGPCGPYLQSERRETHKAYALELIRRGHAYYCFCTKERLEELAKQQTVMKQATMYDRLCRKLSKEEAERRVVAGESHVIRLAVPLEGSIKMQELIRGEVEVPWSQVDDQVLVKSDGYPTYHLAATCDDHDMRISHVIRGDDWLSSLPKHLFLFQAMGWEAPQYAHLPLLLNPDRSKLSKRQGDVAVEDYLAKGYLPEALLNFVALLGWNPTADREVFTKEELAELFDIGKVNKAGAVFNLEKLDWLNGQYLKTMPEGEYLAACRLWMEGVSEDQPLVDRACLLVRERLTKLSELKELTAFVFKPRLDHDPAILPWKTQPIESTREKLFVWREFLAERPADQFAVMADVERDLRALIADKSWANGDALWPLRVALSGSKQSPGPFELLVAYGKERALARIDEALSKLV